MALKMAITGTGKKDWASIIIVTAIGSLTGHGPFPRIQGVHPSLRDRSQGKKPGSPEGGESLHTRLRFLGGTKMSAEQTPNERRLAELIVESLNLEDIEPTEIEPEKPLFGGEYGLDSIDALELALAISKTYGVQLKADDENNRHVFANLRSLNAHIESLQS
jgi:acyl carrier protein